MEIKVGTCRTIPIYYGLQSLIGVPPKRPVSWGNYFDLIYDNREYRVLNMWIENLKAADRRFNLGGVIDVILYKKAVLIDDYRIPSDWYYNKFYSLNWSRMEYAEAKEALTYIGEEQDLDFWTDRAAHYAKRGGVYDPNSGVVVYKRKGQPPKIQTTKIVVTENQKPLIAMHGPEAEEALKNTLRKELSWGDNWKFEQSDLQTAIESGEFIWCNTHQRLAKKCKTEGGIMMRCKRINLFEHFKIEDDGKDGITFENGDEND